MPDASLETFKSVVLNAAIATESARIHCPSCSAGRRKSHLKTLSVDVVENRAVYKCHHCDETGAFTLDADWVAPLVRTPRPKKDVALEISEIRKPLGESHYEWLSERGISAATADRCGVMAGTRYFSSVGERSCIGFPYENPDGSTAVKWRDRDKHFSQSGSAQSLWGIENFTGGDLVICEGELDRLSFEEVGIAAVSVPNGAPSPRKDPSGAPNTPEPAYLWNAKEAIENADRVIIATDADGPGNALADELARRIGKARCWRMIFPNECKDSNDVLVNHGALELVECMENSTPWPLAGLRDASEYKDEALALYHRGFDQGLHTGIADLDRLFRVVPQSLTVVTGIPGSGKSTFVSWLMVHLASKHRWNVGMMNAETSPQVHVLQLASSHKEEPFRGGGKMDEKTMGEGLDFVGEHFVFLEGGNNSIDSIIDRAHAAVLRKGIRALVLDPFNFITAGGKAEDGSVAGINTIMVRLKDFAVQHGIAVFLIAHPIKMFRQSDGSVRTPGGYDVSGSSGFFNTCDTGVSLVRAGPGRSTVACWKQRFSFNGSVGEAELEFDEARGKFSTVKSGWDKDNTSGFKDFN